MRAYGESYLNDAMETLGGMLDYVVHDCGIDADEFFGWFISSGTAARFGVGNPRLVAGMGGAELADEVLFLTKGERCSAEPTQALDRTPEYWAGWALAYYQWYRACSFADMAACGLVPSALTGAYILHEADLTKLVAFCDGAMESQPQPGTRLSWARELRGLTQRELAQAADVSLRMVQLYEQGQNDLSKASADTLLRLCRVLGCRPEELVDAARR